jgi:hypothetical protein
VTLSSLAERDCEVFLFDAVLFSLFEREPSGGTSQQVTTIFMLIFAGWLPQDNPIDRELPLSTCVDRVPEHAPE